MIYPMYWRCCSVVWRSFPGRLGMMVSPTTPPLPDLGREALQMFPAIITYPSHRPFLFILQLISQCSLVSLRFSGVRRIPHSFRLLGSADKSQPSQPSNSSTKPPAEAAAHPSPSPTPKKSSETRTWVTVSVSMVRSTSEPSL